MRLTLTRAVTRITGLPMNVTAPNSSDMLVHALPLGTQTRNVCGFPVNSSNLRASLTTG
jgi:hypothetical protein